MPVPDEIEGVCVVLPPYAVEVRYPDDGSNPTLEDAREARHAAERLAQWVLPLSNSSGPKVFWYSLEIASLIHITRLPCNFPGRPRST
jgi:hypothetical protein